jgi:integrase
MSTTQPIKDKKKLKEFENYYRKNNSYNIRNYCLIKTGLNTALRISDILSLKYEDVYDDTKVRRYITVRERKTGKLNQIYLNEELRNALSLYRRELVETEMYKAGNSYLFPSPRKNATHLSRYQAYRIIRSAADAVGEKSSVSCHSLRKTFGYHAWKSGKDPMVIMQIFNHSSLNITKRYLGIDQDDKDAVYRSIML